jgi:hypothetical protein
MSALDAFSLPPAAWDEVEQKYESVMNLDADKMLISLLTGSSPEQQQWFALGIMVGRASRICQGDEAR